MTELVQKIPAFLLRSHLFGTSGLITGDDVETSKGQIGSCNARANLMYRALVSKLSPASLTQHWISLAIPIYSNLPLKLITATTKCKAKV